MGPVHCLRFFRQERVQWNTVKRESEGSRNRGERRGLATEGGDEGGTIEKQRKTEETEHSRAQWWLRTHGRP